MQLFSWGSVMEQEGGQDDGVKEGYCTVEKGDVYFSCVVLYQQYQNSATGTKGRNKHH